MSGRNGVRLNRRHQEMCRDKIRTSQLINRLMNHVQGKIDLSQTQLKSIEILLKKCLPDLKQIEHVGSDGELLPILRVGWDGTTDDRRPANPETKTIRH